MSLEDTRMMLDRWGRWSRDGNVTGTEYKSPMQILRRHMIGGVVGMPPIHHDIPMLVDGVVARLKQRDEELAEVLRRYYVGQITKHALAKAMRMDRRRAEKLLHAAECWVDGALEASILVA